MQKSAVRGTNQGGGNAIDLEEGERKIKTDLQSLKTMLSPL